MQKRIEQVRPVYKIADWVEDWKKNAELTELITAFPEQADQSSSHPPKLSTSTSVTVKTTATVLLKQILSQTFKFYSFYFVIVSDKRTRS